MGDDAVHTLVDAWAELTRRAQPQSKDKGVDALRTAAAQGTN